MRDFVIDANVLMGILISGKASYRQVLRFYNFVLPDFALIEVDKYRNVILDKTKKSDDELIAWTTFVFANLNILPQYILKRESIEKANRLLANIDMKDTSYVALALQLDLVLLTRDIPLYKGLKKLGFRKVMLFEDFLRAQ